MSSPIPPYQPPIDWQDVQQSGQHKEVAELVKNLKVKSKKRVELPNFL